MEKRADHPCEYLIPYVIGEISDEEKHLFHLHLQACDSCREEVEHLQKAWHIIPYDLDEVEVPADLKEEVMNAIFATPPYQQEASTRTKKGWKKTWFPASGWVAAAIFLALFTGTVSENIHLRQKLQVMDNPSQFPTQILKQYTLNAAHPAMASAKGNVWLVQQGNQHKLIVNIQGLSKTKGEQAYQIWLIHDGKRRSSGVFHVDEKGNGIVSYEMENQDLAFEAIGITLEPDPYGTQPRGNKVLGT